MGTEDTQFRSTSDPRSLEHPRRVGTRVVVPLPTSYPAALYLSRSCTLVLDADEIGPWDRTQLGAIEPLVYLRPHSSPPTHLTSESSKDGVVTFVPSSKPLRRSWLFGFYLGPLVPTPDPRFLERFGDRSRDTTSLLYCTPVFK